MASADAQNFPPFWPEENCQNSMVVSGGANAGKPIMVFFGKSHVPHLFAGAGFGQQSVNVFSSAFDIIQYAGGRGAGPMINDSVTPCRILAYVGQASHP